MASREGCRVGQKMTNRFGTILVVEEIFISTCRSSRVIRLRLNSKIQQQMFLLLYAAMFVAPTWRLHTKLFKYG